MIETIITNYLKNNRRIVVPELGAFLKKEDEKVVFVTFLNKDDGILNSLVKDSYGVSQSDAASIIAKYVANVRSGISSEREYLVAGVGMLKYDAHGIIYLDTNESRYNQASTIQFYPHPEPPTPVSAEPTPRQVTTPPAPTPPPIPSPRPMAMPRNNTIPQRPIKSKKSADIILILAIIIAAIAIFVMVYSYYVQQMPPLNLK